MGDPNLDREDIVEMVDAGSPTAVHEATVGLAKQVLGADTVHFVRTEGGELEPIAAATTPTVKEDGLPVAADVVDQLELIGRSHVFDDVCDVRSMAASAPSTSSTYTPRSLLLVPINGVGFIVASRGEAGAFDDADRRWAEQLATLVGGILGEDLNADPPTSHAERIAEVLSREFTEPLMLAQGSVELAEASDDVSHLELTHTAIDRIERLLAGTERLARADGLLGRLELVELRSIVNEVWPTLDQDDATVDVVDTRPLVGNRHALRQLFTNLLDNAIEHGGERVRVGTTEDAFFVEDDGPGIPEARRGEVFEWGSSSKSGHKGIGLNVVAQICEAHGWDVHVTDGERGGARFVIRDLQGNS